MRFPHLAGFKRHHFVTPVEAARVSLSALPETMYTRSTYILNILVKVNAGEALDATTVRFDLIGPTPAWVIFDIRGKITGQSGHFAAVSLTLVSTRSNGYGYGNTYGYSYGYQDLPGETTRAAYDVTLSTAGMSPGMYTREISVTVPPGETKVMPHSPDVRIIDETETQKVNGKPDCGEKVHCTSRA